MSAVFGKDQELTSAAAIEAADNHVGAVYGKVVSRRQYDFSHGYGKEAWYRWVRSDGAEEMGLVSIHLSTETYEGWVREMLEDDEWGELGWDDYPEWDAPLHTWSVTPLSGAPRNDTPPPRSWLKKVPVRDEGEEMAWRKANDYFPEK